MKENKQISSNEASFGKCSIKIDYTNVPRPIIYKDLTDIGDFGVDDESSLMGRFFNSMLDQGFMMERLNAEEILLAVYNNAFYICTLVSLEKRPRLYLSKYFAIASDYHKDDYWEFHIMPSTMALVYSMLICSGKYSVEDKFMKSIWNKFQDWDQYKGYCEGKDNFYKQVFTSYKMESFKQYDMPGRYVPIYTKGPYEFHARTIPTLFSLDSPIIKSEDFVDGLDYLLNELFGPNYNDEDRQRLLPLIAERIEDLYIDDRMFERKNRKHFDAYLKIEDAYKRAGLKWKSPFTDDDPTEQETEQDNFNQEELLPPDTADNNLIFNEKPSEEIESLKKYLNNAYSTIEELKEKLSEYKEKNNCINSMQAARLGLVLAPKLGIVFSNKKQLAPLLSGLFGWGKRKLEQKMSQIISPEEELSLANIFGELSPDLAKEICKDWKPVQEDSNEAPQEKPEAPQE